MKDETPTAPAIHASEIYLPVKDLKTEMPFFLGQLGFRLEEIFPADDPRPHRNPSIAV